MSLHCHRFGPRAGADDLVVLALHGVTGHGLRWRCLAEEHLADLPIIAPDLRGHGRSPWTPPWNLEQHVADLRQLIADHRRILAVGHSFGGAVALHLTQREPDRIKGLVLLDPAVELPPDRLLQAASDTVAYPDYTDAAEARAEMAHGAWSDVPPDRLDEELAEHLVPLSNGRYTWRMSVPAIVSAYGELARERVLPPARIPTVLVQALRVQPPYVTGAFRAALSARLGANLAVHGIDCGHMVPLAQPEATAALIRKEYARLQQA
jgi:lipase